jgi:drug/metabolite transporter (DMT)-like permease
VDTSPRVRLAAAYAAVSLIWGSTYLAIKVGLASFDPYFFAGIRYVAATALGLGVARWRGVAFSGPLRRWLPAFAVGVLFVGVCNGAVFWGETRLDSSYTALLITASPVWAALLTPLTPGERRLAPAGWAGIVLGFVGTVLLLEPWRALSPELVAALVLVGSAFVWGATSLWVRRLRERYEPFAFTVAQMGAGAVTLLAVAALRGRALVAPVTPRSVAALAYLVVFGSLVGFSSYFYLLKHMEATRAASSSYINPVVAMVLGSMVLGEAIRWNMIAGVIVVLAGVWLVMREGSGQPGVFTRVLMRAPADDPR